MECFPSVFEGWDSNPSTMTRQGCEGCPQSLWLITPACLCPALSPHAHPSPKAPSCHAPNASLHIPASCLHSFLPPNLPFSHHLRDGVLRPSLVLPSAPPLGLDTQAPPLLTDTAQGHAGLVHGQPSWPCLQELGWADQLSLNSKQLLERVLGSKKLLGGRDKVLSGFSSLHTLP